MRRRGIVGLALAGASATLLACATPIQERPWLEARSENFVLYSLLGPDETRALAADLELFRAAVRFFTNAREVDPPVPFEIVAFAKDRDLQRFGAERNVAGFIHHDPRGYRVALAPSASLSERVIVYHEYVHFLVRNNRGRILPRWYDEGFADFLATAEREEDGLLIGKAHPLRAATLVYGRKMSVADLLEPGILAELDEDETGRFYAWSWLLVHYLSWDFQDPQGRSFDSRMATYLRALERSIEPVEALELAWGMTAEELDERLDEAVRTGVMMGRLPLSRLEYAEDVSLRPVEAAGMARRLGDLALAAGELSLARGLYQSALAANPDDARALAGLADTYKFEGRMDLAEPLFERAVERDPQEVLNLLDRAEYWLSRAGEAEKREAIERFARRALRDGQRALRLAPESPEALWVCGVSETLLPERERDPSLWALERAAELLPSDSLILFSLMDGYAATGRRDEAERVAQWLIARAHGKQQIEEIGSRLEAGLARGSLRIADTADPAGGDAESACRL